MPERKPKRKSPFDLFGFDEDLFSFGKEFESIRGKRGGGSGCSISVTYDEKPKPVVRIQTHGEVDSAELRQDILRRYLGAKIEGLKKQPLIRIVAEEEQKPELEKKRVEEKKKNEKKKTTSIRIVE